MRNLIYISFMLFSFIAANANADVSREKNVTLVKYENGIGQFKIPVCPADAEIKIEVELTPNKEVTLAFLSFYVPEIQCFAFTFQILEVNVKELLNKTAVEKGLDPATLVFVPPAGKEVATSVEKELLCQAVAENLKGVDSIDLQKCLDNQNTKSRIVGNGMKSVSGTFDFNFQWGQQKLNCEITYKGNPELKNILGGTASGVSCGAE